MSLRFHGDEPKKKTGSPPPRRPPNYLSRRVQWKVFMLVAMFMLVIILMQEARKPENWQWMWNLDGGQGNLSPVDDGPVDTRLREPTEDTGHLPGFEALIVAGDGGQIPLPDAERPADPPPADLSPSQQSERDAWSRLLESLSREDRECFLAGLKTIRDGQPLDSAASGVWPGILDHLDLGWKEYLGRAFLAVAEEGSQLTDAEKKAWLDVIEQLRQQWGGQLLPALRSLASEEPPSPVVLDSLQRLQAALDGVFLTTIKDSTVFRPGEKDAWFRMLEQLDRTDLADLESRSVGRVSFLQIYRQPDDYRGELVTVQGSLRLGYYRQAPRNFYGIPGYYIFWLKPTGSNSPMVVYCLDVPPGFPDVRQLEQETDKPELNETVEFTGFFFKRWAYRAEDGTRLAPLILAKLPRWEPPLDDAASVAGPPPWPLIALLAGGAAAFGVLFAIGVYLSSRQVRSPVQLRRSRQSAKSGRSAAPPDASAIPQAVEIVTQDEA